MRRINLIPPEARRLSTQDGIKKYLFKSRTSRFIIFSVLILFSIFIYQATISVRYRIKISLQKRSLENLKIELAQSQDEQRQIRKKIDVIEQKSNYLKKKLSFLEKTKREAVKWSEVLLCLSKLTPSDLWLDKLCLNKEMIIINGTTLDNSRVSDFMVKLDESGYFKATSFNFTQKKKGTDERLKEFPVIDFELTTQLAR